MVAAKEKILSPKVDPIVNRMDNQLARQPATTTTPSVVNRISNYDFRTRKFSKPPIGTSEKIRCIVPLGAHTKPRKTTGENAPHLRQTRWAPELSLYRAYFVPDAMDPTGTDRWVGSDENGNKIFWSGGFCYVRGSGGALVRVDCPGGQGPVEPGAVEAGATTVCVFITVDTCTPEPTDVVWPKWVCYAVAGAAAGAVFYCCRRVVVPCSFADCDGGFKPCGDILINKCQWDKTLGGMSICGCFP